MTSLEEQERRLTHNNDECIDFKPQTANFTINPPNTTIQITRTLYLLNSVESQNIFKYREEFIETAKLCGWDEDTQNTVLLALTSAELHPLYHGTTTTSEKFTALLKNKYPEESAINYYNRITNTKQNDFVTIDSYLKEIEYICKRLAVCKSWTSSMTNQRKEEFFFNGLTKRTQLEMARLNVKNLSEMYNIIRTTENTMIEQIKNFRSNRKSNFMESTEKLNSKRQDTGKSSKYCSYHKSTNHSSEECRTKNKVKKFNKQYENKNIDKTLALREPLIKFKSLETKCRINNKNFQAIIDTGSAYNYIRSDIVKELKLSPETTEE
ncbi:MAG: retropepsin-like aspartic protease, partial [Aeromonas sp.]